MVFLRQVEAAIAALRDRDGSTGQQIQTFLETNYKTTFDKGVEGQLHRHLRYNCHRCSKGAWKIAKWKVRDRAEKPVVHQLVNDYDELMFGSMRKNKMRPWSMRCFVHCPLIGLSVVNGATAVDTKSEFSSS